MDARMNALLGVVRIIATNGNFQQSAVGMLQSLGQQLAGKIDNPEAKTIVSNMIANAPSLVGAMVKGTRAEALIDPKFIPTHTDVAALQGGHCTGPLAPLARTDIAGGG